MQAQTQTDGQEPGDSGDLSARAGGVLRVIPDLLSRGVGDDDGTGRAGHGRAACIRWPGLGAYLLVAALLVVAVRVFRGLAWHSSFGEICGIVGFLAGSTVLLHLAFAGATASWPGPGGFMGQWLGEVTAGFVGTVGAGPGGLGRAADLHDGAHQREPGGGQRGGRLDRPPERARPGHHRARDRAGSVVAMFPAKTDRELLDAADNLLRSVGASRPVEPDEAPWTTELLRRARARIRRTPSPCRPRSCPSSRQPRAHPAGHAGDAVPPRPAGPPRRPCCTPCRPWRASRPGGARASGPSISTPTT